MTSQLNNCNLNYLESSGRQYNESESRKSLAKGRGLNSKRRAFARESQGSFACEISKQEFAIRGNVLVGLAVFVS